VAARRWAEGELEDRARQALDPAVEAERVHAAIHSFPFLGRLLASGTVSRIRLAVAPVTTTGLVFDEIEVDLRGVRVDRDLLVRKRQLELTAIDTGTVTAVLTERAVSDAVGVHVTFLPGRVAVTVAGVEVGAAVEAKDNVLVVTPERGPALRLPIPEVPFLACATSAEVRQGQVAVRCTVEDVPPELLRAASRAPR
jgi:LmeA-like phospholipid-binding